jgi:acetolactate synthase-1/3 small subunit
VVKVRDLSEQSIVERDLLLLKVHSPPEKRAELRQITEVFRGSIVDVGPQSVVIQLTGPEDKIEAFVELCRPYGIKQLSRTGVIAIPRATQPEETIPVSASRPSRVRKAKVDGPPSAALPPS